MRKKGFILLGAAVLLAGAILIPPVRAAAESVLSVFRVGDTHTISITIADLQEMSDTLKNISAPMHDGADAQKSDEALRMKEEVAARTRTLSDVRDFSAFPFSLPTALKSETPTLTAVDSKTETVKLDTEKINAVLQKLGATVSVDASLNGTAITVTSPSAILAEYSDVVLAATQTVSVDAPDAALASLKNAVLSVPALPEDIRAQLLPINPKTHDIYLPVVEGFGREINLGSTTGYLYASADLAQVLAMLPQTADSTVIQELQGANKNVLIWTKNGVLFLLAGEKTDGELAQIARSIR